MKLRLLLFLCGLNFTAFAQNSLELIDISQKQLQLMERYEHADSLTRKQVFADSVYTPYAEFWNGYLGDAEAVASWMNEAMSLLPEWKKKNDLIDGKLLTRQFRETAQKMAQLTGYQPKGKWYIVYGPAWTDLGGLGDFAMLIDLAHSSNSSNERILRMFPHELTHQIMTNVNEAYQNTSVLTAVVGEGFAVWMNEKYWGKKYTLAENLGYSEVEVQLCDKNLETLKKFLAGYGSSTDGAVINVFRNRGEKINEKMPGAIGYYLGYQIVKNYVQKFGKNSWRDLFEKSPEEIYKLSGLGN